MVTDEDIRSIETEKKFSDYTVTRVSENWYRLTHKGNEIFSGWSGLVAEYLSQ